MKSLFYFVVLLSSLEAFAESKETVLSSGQTIGYFSNLTWGDYSHIEILVDNKKISYFCEKGPCSVFEDNLKKLKGEKIKVSWEQVKKYIPEAAMEETITRTTDICSFKPIKFTSVIKQKVNVCK